MIKKLIKKDPPPIVNWMGAINGILGTSVLVIVRFFSDNRDLNLKVGVGVWVLSIIIGIVAFVKESYKHQNDMDVKNRDLKEKCKELEAKELELTDKNKLLADKDKQIDELKDRITACKKALTNEGALTPLDYYRIDKDAYDDFKTDLSISCCYLEVELVKTHENLQNYNLRFQWTLEIENPGPLSASMAKFIYSGDEASKSKSDRSRDEDSRPEINVVTEGIGLECHSTKPEIKVWGDDIFVQIDFASDLAKGKSAVIHIDYIFEKYEFNRNHDRIWLVPDALGFADMKEFCIRFYCDGEIVHKKTKVRLKSYGLKGEYKQGFIRSIKYKELDNGKIGFEAKSGRKETLHGHGYVLELSNGTNK